MLRIVHFGKYYPPDYGGIESVTESAAVAARKRRNDVTVVCFVKRGPASDSIEACVRIIRCKPLFTLASQPIGLSYLFWCLRLGRRSDVVHLHVPNMLAGLAALLLPRRIRVVIHWHSDVIGRPLLSAVTRPIEALMVRRAERIIVTSANYGASSSALRAAQEKIRAIPIGIADRSSKKDGLTEPAAGKLTRFIAGKKLILSVGRLVPYKGFDILIEAARKLPPGTVVVIVGDGPLRKQLLNAVARLGLEDRVLITGKVDQETLDWLFARADIFCMSSISRAEAFGVVLLEAMSFGLPIVATDIPGSGVPWVNEHGVSGINVPVGDAEALAQACIGLLTDEGARHVMSSGSRRRYLSHFSEQKSTDAVLKLYGELNEPASGAIS